MVFESIIAELLNKVLGEYIQNLDYTQLKLSLWGGKNDFISLNTSFIKHYIVVNIRFLFKL